MTTHFVSNKPINYWPPPASLASPQEPPSVVHGRMAAHFVSNKMINNWPPPASLASLLGPPSIRYMAG